MKYIRDNRLNGLNDNTKIKGAGVSSGTIRYWNRIKIINNIIAMITHHRSVQLLL